MLTLKRGPQAGLGVLNSHELGAVELVAILADLGGSGTCLPGLLARHPDSCHAFACWKKESGQLLLPQWTCAENQSTLWLWWAVRFCLSKLPRQRWCLTFQRPHLASVIRRSKLKFPFGLCLAPTCSTAFVLYMHPFPKSTASWFWCGW